MFKLIFDKDVNLKKKIKCDKGRYFEIAAFHSDLQFVNMKPYESKKCITY